MTRAMILTGPPGSGKSSVLDALCTLFEIDEVSFGAIETESLSRGWPWLDQDQWLPQLAAVLALQREAGREIFLVAATTETEQELREVIEAVGADQVLVVCLTAPAELVADRVADREPDEWPGKAALVAHARELADQIPSIEGIDVLLSTDGRDPRDVAAEISELLISRGIAGPAPRSPVPLARGALTFTLDDRTQLRSLEESDARELYTLIAANREYLAKWMPWAAAQTEEGTLEFIRTAGKQARQNQGFQAAIVEDSRIVGVLGFHRVDWENRSTSVGYWIAEAAQGQGTATRAVAALVAHAFRVWKLNRVEIHAAVGNDRSRALARRLGFAEEGVLRQAERLGDRFVDHVVYALLVEEWRAPA